jgi:hypothetical protein
MSAPSSSPTAWTSDRSAASRSAESLVTAVVPDVCCQRRAAPASCARLQSRQLPAHAGNAGADQGLVGDEPEEETDQDLCKGRQPWPHRRPPDGRGRHSPTDVPGDIAPDRGTTATATICASMTRPMVRRSKQPMRGVCPDASKHGEIRLSATVGSVNGDGNGPRRQFVLPKTRQKLKNSGW